VFTYSEALAVLACFPDFLSSAGSEFGELAIFTVHEAIDLNGPTLVTRQF
jgi:hypothetical protein